MEEKSGNREDQGRVVTERRQSCDILAVRGRLGVFARVKKKWLQDVMDIPLGCHGHTVGICLRRVPQDTGALSEGATCAWMVSDEAVDCTPAFITMWRSSRGLVCRKCPKPSLRINDNLTDSLVPTSLHNTIRVA
ncbi:hypothetical protein TNCV_473431 [Trichonephila clavipes]|nr:hypothetical protein TNCV_473431 [Trichonephila clavipes]